MEFLLELLFVLVLLSSLFLSASVRSLFKKVKPVYVLFFAIFLVLVLGGQFGKGKFFDFPFPSWTMYGKVKKDQNLVFYEYFAELPNGSEVKLNPSSLVLSLSNSQIETKLRDQINSLLVKDEQRKRTKHEKLMLSLAKIFQKDSGKRIEKIKVYKSILNFAEFQNTAKIHNELLWEIPMRKF
ncbi:MAG: hypothetical protein DWQ06_02585 [Calditrichaeota bacterium]|nr:MAG: hypothetical protein DWQ06_02585 [Calditrichota bacterium]